MRKSQAPRVSVLMSVYNGERYLRETIDSIIAQTFNDFEFIIVDDGSTDRTPKILDSYDDPRIVRLHNPKNIGLTRSLNKGLRLARGEFVARQDVGDVSFPERLEAQANYFRRHRDIGLLSVWYNVVDKERRFLATYREPTFDTEIRWQMLFHNALCHSALMFRREGFGSTRVFYDEALIYAQDYEFCARMLRHTRGANLNAVLAEIIVGDSGISNNQYHKQQEIATEIAMEQIRKLLPQVYINISQVEVLRSWYYRFPNRLNRDDLAQCLVLVKMLTAFGNQKNVDADVVYRIRQQWSTRILNATTAKQLMGFCKTGLGWNLFRENYATFFIRVLKYGTRMIKRLLLFGV
jgi:glycosyltransferase involved in cell wall biosynthesis